MSTYPMGESGWDFECDECDRPPELYDGEDFLAALAKAKRDGWQAYKDRTGAWCHRCPTCAEAKEQRESKRRETPKARQAYPMRPGLSGTDT